MWQVWQVCYNKTPYNVQNCHEHYLYSLFVFFRFWFCFVRAALNSLSLVLVLLRSEFSFSTLESFASSAAHLLASSAFFLSDSDSLFERLEIVVFDEAEYSWSSEAAAVMMGIGSGGSGGAEGGSMMISEEWGIWSSSNLKVDDWNSQTILTFYYRPLESIRQK